MIVVDDTVCHQRQFTLRSRWYIFQYNYATEMPYSASTSPGMEITGIASQFAMQSRPICDASSQMHRTNCDA